MLKNKRIMKAQMMNFLKRQIVFTATMLIYFNLAWAQNYDINFTMSDGAQKHQIGFDGLGFLSGDFCACTFVPPGKVADYFGFQYLRDNDITGMGHNSDFSSIIANNLLFVLTDAQKALIVQTAIDQVDIIKQYAYMRLPLIDAFVRMRDNNMPTGSPGLDREAVMTYSANLYKVDGRVCIKRAQVYSSIINSLNATQKHYLDSISVLGAKNMPVLPDQIDKKPLNNNQFVGVMSIADDIFSWYVGSVAADVYFCPERQANYFGSFYLKDAPAMGNPNYSIDTSLSQTGGERFVAELDSTQAQLINVLLETQRTDMNLIVDRRTDISNLLRMYLSNNTVDTSVIISLSDTYGRLDGEVSYYYAKNFSKVNWTLTAAQKDSMMKIRNLDDYPCNGAYLYSDPISMPTIQNTDFLFLPATSSSIVIKTSINIENSGTTTGDETYNPNDIVIVTATAKKGYTFTNWTENGTEVSKSSTYQFTASVNRNLVANFTLSSYPITTSVIPENSGTVTGAGNYTYGTNVSLKANAATGYTFTKWTENGTQVSANANYSFTANKSRNLVANFTINSYSIVASAMPANSGSISGTGNYNYGTNVTLIATANNGYKFVNWTEGGNTISTETSLSFTANANRNLLANFSSTVNVLDIQNENSIDIFPNPANEVLYIKGITGEISVSISDMNGKIVLNKLMNQNHIDISNLPNGVFTLQIMAKKDIFTKKFIKQ
jgi:uncharacterized repeat protein (TIGR02543 family)